MGTKPQGPFTLWQNHGYDGWQFTDFASIRDALEADKFSHEWIIQKSAPYDVVDIESVAEIFAEFEAHNGESRPS